MSDKQGAFVSGIAAEFPGVPHRHCQNHFLRDVAQPMLESDSRAKVRMRSKVRGLRSIERQILQDAFGDLFRHALMTLPLSQPIAPPGGEIGPTRLRLFDQLAVCGKRMNGITRHGRPPFPLRAVAALDAETVQPGQS